MLIELFSPSLMPFFKELTYRSDTSTDFHAWWLKRRGLAQGCAFFGNFSHCSPFRGSKTPKTPNFGAWIGVWKNRKITIFRPRFNRFSRNLACWCSSTPLTAPTIKNLKFQKSKMAAAVILKRTKIEISRQRSTDRYEILHGDAIRHLWCVPQLELCNLKNPTWRRPPSWKIEKLVISQSQFQRFQRNLARWRCSALVADWWLVHYKFKI